MNALLICLGVGLFSPSSLFGWEFVGREDFVTQMAQILAGQASGIEKNSAGEADTGWTVSPLRLQ
jgi:hypothetical protein